MVIFSVIAYLAHIIFGMFLGVQASLLVFKTLEGLEYPKNARLIWIKFSLLTLSIAAYGIKMVVEEGSSYLTFTFFIITVITSIWQSWGFIKKSQLVLY